MTASGGVYPRRESCQPQSPARFAVGRFKVNGHAQTATKIERRSRQRLPNREAVGPDLDQIHLAASYRTIRNAVKRLIAAKEVILFAFHQAHHVVVQVGRATGHDIDNGEADALVKVVGALGGKGDAFGVSILVRWADELDGTDEYGTALIAKDLDSISTGENGRQFERRHRRTPAA